MNDTEPQRVRLTAHPLQRVGAFALARLGEVDHPDQVSSGPMQIATDAMTRDATAAALSPDTKQPTGESFWLKCSHSLFPNAPMNHPGNGKKDENTIRAEIGLWRRIPDALRWPGAACVLCGQPAVRYCGKRDVPLAESDSYRNTTPRGHDGMALCWPCMCSFYALPYGCQLTGGPAIAVHSWDDQFLAKVVGLRVQHNRQVLRVGQGSRKLAAREVVALRALRTYEQRLAAGVELLVFSNNNKGQTLEIYAMDQPLAEWLRRTMRLPERRQAFPALVAAHRGANILGVAQLARHAFHEPDRIVSACARYLARPAAEHGVVRPQTGKLAELSFSYCEEVMAMDDEDLDEIKATAGRMAAVLSDEQGGGRLLQLYVQQRDQKRFRSWLQRQAVDWALQPREGHPGPLVTTRGFELLFDPNIRESWFNRQLLLIAVLEELHHRGWRPGDAEEVARQLREQTVELPQDEAEQLDESEEKP